jgi:hypothetical protein
LTQRHPGGSFGICGRLLGVYDAQKALKTKVQERRDTRLEQIDRKRSQLPVDTEDAAKMTESDGK